MEGEENVYGKTTQTEAVAQAREGAEDRKESAEEASTVLGKFKDVDALARAYGSLQAEFTRRSQRLRELERLAENPDANERRGEGSGAEKLRKNAESRRAETKRFDQFVKETEGLEASGPAGISGQALEDREAASVGTDGEAETDEGNVRAAVAEGIDGTFSSEELYRRASRDEEVRLKIIGEYLASIGKSGAPLTAGGAGSLATPPAKARSISDAGAMALRYFKEKSARE